MMHSVKPTLRLWLMLPALWLQACVSPVGLVPAPLEVRRNSSGGDALGVAASDPGKSTVVSPALPRPPLGL